MALCFPSLRGDTRCGDIDMPTNNPSIDGSIISNAPLTQPGNFPRRYYMVHTGMTGNPSSVMHYTRESAEAEAARLAQANLGRPFFVMVADAYFQVKAPKATQTLL